MLNGMISLLVAATLIYVLGFLLFLLVDHLVGPIVMLSAVGVMFSTLIIRKRMGI